MKFSLTLIVLCLFIMSGGATAQQDPNLRDESEARTIRFICLAYDMPQYFYDVRKSERVEIGSSMGSFSRPHPMPTDRILQIYRKVLPPPDAPAGTKPLKQILATTKIPTGFSKAIVLLAPDGEKLRIKAFGDSYRLHPKGKIRVFNLAPMEIRLKVGDVAGSFKPGQEGVMPWSGDSSNVVVFQSWVKPDDDWVVVGINELATRPHLRAFMFVGKGIPYISSKVVLDAVPE